MNNAEVKYLKLVLDHAHYLLVDAYIMLRLRGMGVNELETASIAKFLYKEYGEDAETMFSGYKVAMEKDE